MSSIHTDFAKRSDLTNYRGAWIYPTDYGYEANLKGFHYDAETLEELMNKIDNAIKYFDVENTLKLYSADSKYYRVINEDGEEEQGPQWSVIYHLGEPESDDSFEDTYTKEVVITAPNVEAAVRYAQQYVRKMKADPNSSSMWENAEIISIEQR